MKKDLALAPLVMLQRTPLLWLEMFGLGGGSNETGRMVQEKFAAAAEGVIAAQVEWQAIWMQSALAICQGVRPPGLIQSGNRLASAALKPAARRVKQNARRLGKRKSF